MKEEKTQELQSIFSIEFVVSSFSLISIKFALILYKTTKEDIPRNNHFTSFLLRLIVCNLFSFNRFFFISFLLLLLLLIHVNISELIHDSFIIGCYYMCINVIFFSILFSFVVLCAFRANS